MPPGLLGDSSTATGFHFQSENHSLKPERDLRVELPALPGDAVLIVRTRKKVQFGAQMIRV